MSIISTGTKLSAIQRKSQNTIGIFQKTLNDFAKIEGEIEKEDAVKAAEINALEEARMLKVQERASLNEVKASNAKIANKIKEFLND